MLTVTVTRCQRLLRVCSGPLRDLPVANCPLTLGRHFLQSQLLSILPLIGEPSKRIGLNGSIGNGEKNEIISKHSFITIRYTTFAPLVIPLTLETWPHPHGHIVRLVSHCRLVLHMAAAFQSDYLGG
jgi:hypothetical protein